MDNALIHALDSREQMRARLVRRLRADIELLDDGLTALDRDPPKIHVTQDHISRVLQSLRAELTLLMIPK
jgi:hypothetical protein